jgi:hypothetical protein
MDLGMLWVALSVVGSMGGAVFRHFRHSSPAGRALSASHEVPRTPIAEVHEGATVKIAGTVTLLEDPLVAPFSGSRCAGYLATWKGEAHFPQQGVGGHRSVSQERWCDFVLDDGTGRALVRVGADVAVDGTRPLSPSPAGLERVRAFLDSFDPKTAMVPDDDTSPQEWTLSEGDFVTVFGAARWERDPDPEGNERSGYRDAPHRLVVCAPATRPLLVILGEGSHTTTS